MRHATRAMAAITAAITAAALAAALAGGARAEDYRLGPGDVLRITVLDRPDLSLDATRLRPGGALMLPRLGTLALGGLTAEEARAAIEARLRDREGLARPEVVVEIAAYRPVFVAGDVSRPGSYEYHPGMTVLHAISLAGSFTRPEPADAAVRLEAGRLRAALGQHADEIAVAAVRRARLLAERDGTALAPPAAAAGLVGPERLAGLLANEAAIRAERDATLTGQVETLRRLQAELDNEVAALRAQLEAKERQAALIEEEAARVADLAARDLVSLQRALEVRRARIEIDADRLEILAFISRAQTARGRIDQEILNLRAARALEILSGIKDEEDRIARTEALVAATQAQLAVADRLAVGLGTAEFRAIAALGAETLTLIRRGPEGDRIIPVTLLDRMRPDDILFVPYQGVEIPAGTASR
jgi:protein involved in polysaccharide export with SLBB domain